MSKGGVLCAQETYANGNLAPELKDGGERGGICRPRNRFWIADFYLASAWSPDRQPALNARLAVIDDEGYTRILRAEPDNDDVRRAYWNWLEENGDPRTPYVLLMRRRLRLLRELEEADSLLASHQPRIDDAWIDLAFPLRIRAPIAGRCYIKPSPDASPYVQVGSRVTPDTVVCLIEAMKLFSEVTAGVHGVVSEVVVAHEARVDYDQILVRVSRPSLDFW